MPVGEILFCIWETRVQDFDAFVRATGYDATEGMYSYRLDGYRQWGDTWGSPGFSQGPSHPVVGLSQDDARAFCRWLTEEERNKGRLKEGQEYRLPTDAEWDSAVGKDEFPWGVNWPPPKGAGNYADESAKRGRYHNWKIISNYDDGFDATAPVGSFAPNRLGIYDLGGNVWEWVENRLRGVRGAAFTRSVRANLASTFRFSDDVDRSSSVGFRVVVTIGSVR